MPGSLSGGARCHNKSGRVSIGGAVSARSNFGFGKKKLFGDFTSKSHRTDRERIFWGQPSCSHGREREREREKARYIVAVPTGTNKQNFSFFWRNPKSQKRSGEPARDGFSVDRPSIRLGFGFALPPSVPPSVVSLCVAHSNYAFSDAHRSHRTFGVLFVEWKGARINE